jgi:hypothetical protein
MKLILRSTEHNSFRPSSLDYQREIIMTQNDVDYIDLIQGLDPQHRYQIVDLEVDAPNQIITQTFPLLSYNHWDAMIYQMGEFFIHRFIHKPQILLAHEKTLSNIDFMLSQKLTQYRCKLFNLQVCLDSTMDEHFVRLVYDEQAEFVQE